VMMTDFPRPILVNINEGVTSLDARPIPERKFIDPCVLRPKNER
jgi:hypothetical protein